jgi:hypothetical protein
VIAAVFGKVEIVDLQLAKASETTKTRFLLRRFMISPSMGGRSTSPKQINEMRADLPDNEAVPACIETTYAKS